MYDFIKIKIENESLSIKPNYFPILIEETYFNDENETDIEIKKESPVRI